MKDSYAFYTDQLAGEYKETFAQVEMYVAATGVDEHAKEEQLGQLLDVLLTAQQAGKPVKKIVGNDLEEFCKAFCSQFNWKNKLYDLMDRIKFLAVGLLVCCVLDMLSLGIRVLEGETVNFWTSVSDLPLSGYLAGLVIAVAISEATNFMVRRLLFKSKRVSMKAIKILTAAIYVATFIIVLAVITCTTPQQQGESIPIWILTLCAAGYLAFYYVINHKRLQAQKREKVRLTDMVAQELQAGTGEALEEKFQKQNTCRTCRGKEPLTMEQFLDREEKIDRINGKTEFLYVLLPLILTGLGLLFGEFDGTVDMIVYAVVLLAVQMPIMIWFWKMERKARVHRAAWIQKKRDELAQQ